MNAYVIWSDHYLKMNLYMIKEFMPSNVCIFPRSMCHGAFSYNSIIQSMSNIDNVRRQMFSCILWSFSLDLSYCEPNEQWIYGKQCISWTEDHNSIWHEYTGVCGYGST